MGKWSVSLRAEIFFFGEQQTKLGTKVGSQRSFLGQDLDLSHVTTLTALSQESVPRTLELSSPSSVAEATKFQEAESDCCFIFNHMPFHLNWFWWHKEPWHAMPPSELFKLFIVDSICFKDSMPPARSYQVGYQSALGRSNHRLSHVDFQLPCKNFRYQRPQFRCEGIQNLSIDLPRLIGSVKLNRLSKSWNP